MLAVAALLAFAVPASIAHTSLVGAYVVIVLLAAAAVAVVVTTARRRAVVADVRPVVTRTVGWIAVLAVLYGVAVTVIHVAA